MKIRAYLIVGILFFCIPIVFYVFKTKEFIISNNPTDWGAFGSYLGGVLSPFFA